MSNFPCLWKYQDKILLSAACQRAKKGIIKGQISDELNTQCYHLNECVSWRASVSYCSEMFGQGQRRQRKSFDKLDAAEG